MRNLVMILISAVLLTGCAMENGTQQSNVNNIINSNVTKGSDTQMNSSMTSTSSQKMDQSSYASMYYSIIKSLKKFR
jgi:PBP1b-binding outer membrane lipoprotein LpoB